MFEKEILIKCKKVKVVWYPIEKLCMVISKKSNRFYKNIPKKYKKKELVKNNLPLKSINFKGGKNASWIKNKRNIEWPRQHGG